MAGIQKNLSSSEPTGWSKAFSYPSRAYEWINGSRPVQLFRYAWSPKENPSEILRRIEHAAQEGIQKAKIGGILVKGSGSQLNQELNEALKKRSIKPAQEAANPNLPDPEVTKAIPLQQQVAQTDWKTKQEEYQQKLINKVAVFATLIQMRNRAGITEKNNLKILALVKEATEGNNPVSVWQLFAKNYFTKDSQVGFFEKIHVALFYWAFYQTSFITNTIQEYLKVFVSGIITDLTTESSETRTKVFRALIENANNFLTEDIQATKAYANGTQTGLLKDVRNRAIEKHYGFSLKALCEKFSAILVAQDPQVEFFKELKENIPVLRLLLLALEWAINKLIIQRTMTHSILPQVLESIVNKGIEATQPDKLPFAISLTQFFTSQLEQLNPENESAAPLKAVAGTELLPPTIKLLIEALKLEGEYTPSELKQIIEKNERGNFFDKISGKIDAHILEQVEQGVIRGGNALFSFLNKSVQSRELIAKLFELSLSPFSGEEKTEERLRAEYEEESLKFQRTARLFFTNLVRKVTSSKPNQNTETAAQIAKDSVRNQTALADVLIDRMEIIGQELQKTIHVSHEKIVNVSNIQNQIISFLEAMKVLESRQEFQDKLEQIDGTHRNEIWKHFGQIFEGFEEIQKNILELQDSSDQYLHHGEIAADLREMKKSLQEIQKKFKDQPRHLENQLRNSYEPPAKKIAKALGPNKPIPTKLDQIMAETSKLSAPVAKKQQALDAIHALYSIDESEGLLKQLYNHQQKKHPSGFSLNQCLAAISGHLLCFSDDDQKKLKSMIADGSNIAEKWGELTATLKEMEASYIASKDAKALDAIHALYPYKKKGALVDLYDYQQGKYSRGFKLSACLGKIAEHLTYFSPQERSSLANIIGTGSNIVKEWDHLGIVLERIKGSYENSQAEDTKNFNRSLKASMDWIDQKSKEYTAIKNSDRARMQEKITNICSQIALLKNTKHNIPPSLSTPLSCWIYTGVQGLAAATPVVTALLGYPWAGAAVAATVGAWHKWQEQPSAPTSNEPLVRSSLKKAGLMGISWIGSRLIAPWVPGINELAETGIVIATGVLTGRVATDGVQNYKQDRGFKVLWNIFNNAYRFSLNPRVYKAATTRLMSSVVNGK